MPRPWPTCAISRRNDRANTLRVLSCAKHSGSSPLNGLHSNLAQASLYSCDAGTIPRGVRFGKAAVKSEHRLLGRRGRCHEAICPPRLTHRQEEVRYCLMRGHEREELEALAIERKVAQLLAADGEPITVQEKGRGLEIVACGA